ncbi:hypothetical protein INS49_010717 [Diaporthe citri]|uniref:uncharacterized protein n=1 Tax=Diaporthe citri TaxID=83186 RepID=UPI001C7E2B38|nr:uncharacterized protein INS49_010717 [Diaporthe citri]KAG6362486.1 hypothetical protein INS49_010717 [Diaporthe citri]
MSTTTDSSRSGADGLGANNAHKGYKDTKTTTTHPPGVPGPDHSARDTLRKQAKPVFNRGPSMLDFTAVTSAGPTPAGEVPPSASYFDGSRLRESHLPDKEEEEQQPEEAMRRQTVTETDSELPRRVPGDEVQGVDAFAPRTSRRETEGSAQDRTSGWTGANDTFGGHT